MPLIPVCLSLPLNYLPYSGSLLKTTNYEIIILFLNSCFQWTMVPSQTPCSTHSATHYPVDLTGLWQKRRFSKCHSFVLVQGRWKHGGAEGAIRLPLQIFQEQKRGHTKRETIYFYSAPPSLRFLKLPPVLFVVVRFLPTTMYFYIRYQVRFEFKVEHSKSF